MTGSTLFDRLEAVEHPSQRLQILLEYQDHPLMKNALQGGQSIEERASQLATIYGSLPFLPSWLSKKGYTQEMCDSYALQIAELGSLINVSQFSLKRNPLYTAIQTGWKEAKAITYVLDIMFGGMLAFVIVSAEIENYFTHNFPPHHREKVYPIFLSIALLSNLFSLPYGSIKLGGSTMRDKGIFYSHEGRSWPYHSITEQFIEEAKSIDVYIKDAPPLFVP